MRHRDKRERKREEKKMEAVGKWIPELSYSIDLGHKICIMRRDGLLLSDFHLIKKGRLTASYNSFEHCILHRMLFLRIGIYSNFSFFT